MLSTARCQTQASGTKEWSYAVQNWPSLDTPEPLPASVSQNRQTGLSNHSPRSLWNINLELLASAWILNNQSEPLNKEQDTRLGLPMKFDSPRFFIHYGTECIFQTNSEPTMSILWSLPREKLIVISPPRYSNQLCCPCFFLLYPTSHSYHPSLPKFPSRFPSSVPRKKQTHLYRQKLHCLL